MQGSIDKNSAETLHGLGQEKSRRWTAGRETIVKRKKHSAPEIVAKLRQADKMVAEGSLQSDIARRLGVSVMTYYRWRHDQATQEEPSFAESREHKSGDHAAAKREQAVRMGELQLENSRLRRLVADILLEKMKLEENGVSRKRLA
jgi:transposase